MHYLRTQNPYEEEKRKFAKFKMLSFLTKAYILGIKYLNANVQCLSIVCIELQSIRMFLEKKWEDLNSSYKHYISNM